MFHVKHSLVQENETRSKKAILEFEPLTRAGGAASPCKESCA